MTMTLRKRSVACLIPHERGCMDTLTGDVYPSVSAVRDHVDSVVFNLVGPTTTPAPVQDGEP